MAKIRLSSHDRNELDQIEGVLCKHLDVISVSGDYESRRQGDRTVRRYLEAEGVRKD